MYPLLPVIGIKVMVGCVRLSTITDGRFSTITRSITFTSGCGAGVCVGNVSDCANTGSSVFRTEQFISVFEVRTSGETLDIKTSCNVPSFFNIEDISAIMKGYKINLCLTF